jgi:hypothetical protein
MLGIRYLVAVVLLLTSNCRFPGGLTRTNLEYQINKFIVNYPKETTWIFNANTPKQPLFLKDFKKDLNLPFGNNHHVLSIRDINNLFYDINKRLDEPTYREVFAKKLTKFAMSSKIIRDDLEENAMDSYDMMNIIRTYLIWNPGNLIPGPYEWARDTDLKNGLDREMFREMARQDPQNARQIKNIYKIITESDDPYERLGFLDTWTDIFNKYHSDVDWEFSDGEYKIPMAEELIFLA